MNKVYIGTSFLANNLDQEMGPYSSFPLLAVQLCSINYPKKKKKKKASSNSKSLDPRESDGATILQFILRQPKDITMQVFITFKIIKAE